MAVTLLVGGDAGVGGDADHRIGQDDLQSKGVEAGCMNALEARRGQGGPAVMHASLWKENALPPHRDRYKTCEVKTDLGGTS